jgi:hypothetical protein
LDGEVPNLGKFAACRRVTRTIYLGSAPTAAAANRGIEDRRVKLGCVMPGESPAVFGDAMRRLGTAATYLYHEGARYWFSTQPTVTKLADDLAEQLKRDPDALAREIHKRVRADLKKPGEFRRVHAMPQSGQDVPDDMDARLVVLGVDQPYSKEPGNAAEVAAKAIWEMRGNTPRLFRNTLVFLAVDVARLEDLNEAVRRFLAWETILGEEERTRLDLSPHQVKQAETQRDTADGIVTARIPEAYQWLLIPKQSTPKDEVGWEISRLSGPDALAVRASKKVRPDYLLTSLAGTVLRLDLDRIPLWRGDHVSLKQLAEDFARYLYLPRLAGPDVLVGAIRSGVGLLTWAQEAFAYADTFDETAGRYRGLRGGQMITLADNDLVGLAVRAEVARKQQEAEGHATGGRPLTPSAGLPTLGAAVPGANKTGAGTGPATAQAPTRFHGTVPLNPVRASRDVGSVVDGVISQLTAIVGATVTVTLEIQAEIPTGASENVVRAVTENTRTLKFTSAGFEKE